MSDEPRDANEPAPDSGAPDLGYVPPDPDEPPPLELLDEGTASPDELDAARACGWLHEDGAAESLEKLLEMRPVEREAAVRRFLRTEPPRPRSAAWPGTRGATATPRT